MPGCRKPCRECSCYDGPMAKMKKFDLENPAPVVDDEDEETFAAIDEGIRDAEAERTVPVEEVRGLLLNSTPTKTLWFARGWKRCEKAAS